MTIARAVIDNEKPEAIAELKKRLVENKYQIVKETDHAISFTKPEAKDIESLRTDVTNFQKSWEEAFPDSKIRHYVPGAPKLY